MMCNMLIMSNHAVRNPPAPGSAGRLVLLCGGVSEEHEVSLASARSVLNSLPLGSPVLPLVIARDGSVLEERSSRELLGLARQQAASTGPTAPASGSPASSLDGKLALTIADALSTLDLSPDDVVFPLLHGPYGEDGSVQGVLRVMRLAYVGSGVLASAVGMDKLTMKSVFAAYGLPQVSYRGITEGDYRRDPSEALASVRELGWPLFVKPANLGSSLGIERVADEAALLGAVERALTLDRRVIVESALVGVRELEVAVLGNDEPALSPVGEVRYGSTFYDYHSKYSEGGAELLIPAPVSPEVEGRARALARRAFEAIDAAGLARVDLFYDEAKGELLVNEINTMPGFTATSMYPRLWEAAGVSYPDLVEQLLALARQRR